MTIAGAARTRRTRWGLAARLLLAIAVVLTAAAVTAWLVAAAVGPALFHQHMIRAGIDDHDAAVLHAERAFRDAGAVILTLALGSATAASAAVSLALTRRISRSLAAVSTAAAQVGAGQYESRIPAAGLGAEFDGLTESFNTMARRLNEAERLRARLLADVAHEVRTPVATIAGYLEAIEDGVQPVDATTIAVLRDQAARLTRLAQDLGAVTRAEAGDLALTLEPVQPRELLLAAARASQERAATAGVALRVAGTADQPLVRADRDRVAQVLDNLLSNAIRHTPPGGSVTLTADTRGATVELAVTDTGAGISPEHLPHLFERFYRADTARDRAHGGSGIGLAISKALVEAHAGALTVTSPGPGCGARFTVTLPTA